MTNQFLALDLPAILATLGASLSCALLGNFLLLCKQSLIGDSISHSVLPGIVVAFLLTSSRDGVTVFIGAAIAGVLSVLLTEAIKKLGNVEPSAAMGVVFSVFFAVGVLLLEQASARNIDLDADCLLHGQLETIVWINEFPSEVITSWATLFLCLGIVTALFKELKLSCFDPALASAMGFRAGFINYLLMVLVACSVVASFRIVGSILVIAMLIVPSAIARLLTDRLLTQLILSCLTAILATLIGYYLAAFGPQALGFSDSISAAGMITVASGLMLFVTVLFAPIHGVIAKSFRARQLELQVRREDILAYLYRSLFEGGKKVTSNDLIRAFSQPQLTQKSLNNLISAGLVSSSIVLTQHGEEEAKSIIRSHRLWESYLVDQAGLKPDHVHETAERLEHVTTKDIQEKLGDVETDPHGKKIP